jgi:hypothetical protein
VSGGNNGVLGVILSHVTSSKVGTMGTKNRATWVWSTSLYVIKQRQHGWQILNFETATENFDRGLKSKELQSVHLSSQTFSPPLTFFPLSGKVMWYRGLPISIGNIKMISTRCVDGISRSLTYFFSAWLNSRRWANGYSLLRLHGHTQTHHTR